MVDHRAIHRIGHPELPFRSAQKKFGWGREKSGSFHSGGLYKSMVACCLHHIADIVPILGFSVLAATLQKYQTVFFLGGVISNGFGILLMLRMMAKDGIIRAEPLSKAFRPWFSNSNP